ncbi:hypothetical protein [Oceanisphaera arctica]|uniref:Uncharacterized protein n=1 Tax=Oceanisphaera arctica TaxID=641510 RepID=A0A2P5TIV1_9GAMM|nr:hypothetical protein [Oceanisphaera arctica]PPL14781.1 hypothetical protein UN63_14725 [Oceanisphaera arctica]GHA20629.1 hypothetical protein GCM10007082_21740 [Oceanisphaera arctica]
MLARKCRFPLQSDTVLYVNITVNPCCTIEIDIPDKRQYIRSELKLIKFVLIEQGVLLVCHENGSEDSRNIQLDLSHGDALKLCEMIDEVHEEHEELMSILCY